MKQLVIMPGGFHPFHAGHFALYQAAQQAFPGADIKVAATNDVSQRPFPFAIKEKLAKLAGVKPSDFYQVKSPFQAREITQNYNPDDTELIFVRSEKDRDKPPQAGGIKKNGEPAYLQPLTDQTELEPMSSHAYMAYLPTVEFGPGMTSATEIRSAWPKLNEKRKTALVMSLYPKTQTNPKLAATVVKMLDTAIGGLDEDLFEDVPGFSLKSINEILLIIPRITNRLSDTAGPALKDTVQMTELLPTVISGEATPQQETFVKEHALGILKAAVGVWLGHKLSAIGAALGSAYGPVIEKIVEFVTNHVGEKVLLKDIFNSLQPKATRDWHAQNDAAKAAALQYDKQHPEQDPYLLYKKTRGNPYYGGGVGESKDVAETRIIDPERIDVFYRPDPREPQRRVVARNIPTKALDVLLAKLSDKFSIPEKDFEWSSSDSVSEDYIEEKWSQKYKRSINCAHPRGFSQRAHCAGRKK